MPRLIVMSPRGATRQVPLDSPQTTLGRDSANRLVIESQRASRRHAVLVKDSGGVWLHDLGSSNGTFVNEQRVTCHRLQHGDVVVLGDCKLRFLNNAPAANASTLALRLVSLMGDLPAARHPPTRPGAAMARRWAPHAR
ncbi:FHA domain-containing protein [Variovorax robiniae]|uniref:FHA domain-containing protein n=1 Tax=Variovorax robiniae TaxID=1836199 RepID=A0ABU8XKE5_9BURK